MDFQKSITKDTDPCNDIATMQSVQLGQARALVASPALQVPTITTVVTLSIADAAAAARTAAAAAEAAAAAATTAMAVAKEAAAKLADAEAAAAVKAEEAAAAAARTLAEATAADDAATAALASAKSECDKFLKDSTGAADKVAKATELVQVYQEAVKKRDETWKVLVAAQAAELPFQVPRLRKEVAKLEGELAELNKQSDEASKTVERSRQQNASAMHHAAQNQMSINRQQSTKNADLRSARQQLIAAEVAAGIRFANNHAPYHEMIIRAGMNGGRYNVMCSCGGGLSWTIESAYPPKCGRESQGCGKAGW